MSPDARRILGDLKRHATCFDLTDDGLGESLCKAMTDGVGATIAAQQAPDGTTWDELSPGYAEWKGRHFPGQPMGKLHDLMADPREVAGDVIVPGPETAMVTYGMTEEAREEAAAFQEGDPGRNRPARPFWGFTTDSLKEVGDVLDKRFRKIVG